MLLATTPSSQFSRRGDDQRLSRRYFASGNNESVPKVHMPDKDGILQVSKFAFSVALLLRFGLQTRDHVDDSSRAHVQPTPEIEAMADKFAQMSVVEQVMFGRALAKRIGLSFEQLISSGGGGGGGGGGGNNAGNVNRPDAGGDADAAKKADEAKGLCWVR
jgi:hypothetical protein